jgi:homoserine kinase
MDIFISHRPALGSGSSSACALAAVASANNKPLARKRAVVNGCLMSKLLGEWVNRKS